MQAESPLWPAAVGEGERGITLSGSPTAGTCGRKIRPSTRATAVAKNIARAASRQALRSPTNSQCLKVPRSLKSSVCPQSRLMFGGAGVGRIHAATPQHGQRGEARNAEVRAPPSPSVPSRGSAEVQGCF